MPRELVPGSPGSGSSQVESFYLVLRQIVADIEAARQAAAAVAAAPPQAPGTTCIQQSSQPQQKAVQQPPLLHMVDFGCGTGNLLLPLAALFPGCRFTGVDMKPAALLLLQQRAADAGLSNVEVFEGMIETYPQPFDVALALHACGNATDHVLQLAAGQGAAFVVSPCCVGKLKFSMVGGSSFHSSAFVWTPSMPGDRPTSVSSSMPPLPPPPQQQQGEQHPDDSQQLTEQEHNLQQLQKLQHQPQECLQQQQLQQQPGVLLPQLRHPRSSWLTGLLPQPEHHFRIMARVADIAYAPAEQALLADALAQRAAVAGSCKQFVELDRCAAAAEAGYAVGLFKVLGAETMAKNDLLVGVMPHRVSVMAMQQSQDRAAAAAIGVGAAGAGQDCHVASWDGSSRECSSLRLCKIDCRLLGSSSRV